MTSRTDEPMTWRYERDAEQTRHRIAAGLDELNNRMTRDRYSMKCSPTPAAAAEHFFER
jgi:hypothetical protein